MAAPVEADVARFGQPTDCSKRESEPNVIRFPASRHYCPPRKDIDPALEQTVAVPDMAHSRSPTNAEAIPAIRMIATRYQDHHILKRLNLPPKQWAALFQAMVQVESNYRQTAVSRAGAIGLAQLMPGTARRLRVDPHDPVQNLDGGARYLLTQMERFGSLQLALAAYNAGPEAVEQYGGIPPYRETRSHVVKVMAEYGRLLRSL